MKRRVSIRETLWKGLKTAAAMTILLGAIPSNVGISAQADQKQEKKDTFSYENVVEFLDTIKKTDITDHLFGKTEGDTITALEIGLDKTIIDEYHDAGVFDFNTLSYLHYLGITPSAAKEYNKGSFLRKVSALSRAVSSPEDFIHYDTLIIEQFEAGKISERAMKVFEHYNIENPQRYSAKIMLELEKSMKLDKKTKPTALVIMNKNDHNGAFNNKHESIEKLAVGYSLELYEVSADYEAIELIKSVGEKRKGIDLLMFGAHGAPAAMQFGKGSFNIFKNLSIFDAHKMRGIKKYFNKDSNIVFMSCSTGWGGEDAINISNIIKKYTGARTYAPIQDIYGLYFILDNRGIVSDVKFKYSLDILEVFFK